MVAYSPLGRGFWTVYMCESLAQLPESFYRRHGQPRLQVRILSYIANTKSTPCPERINLTFEGTAVLAFVHHAHQ